MIGLALIVFVTVFAAAVSTARSPRRSTTASAARSWSRTPTASRRSRAMPSTWRGGVDGVSTVSAITYATGELARGARHPARRRRPARRSARCWRLTSRAATRPRSPRLAPNQTILDENFARDKGLGVGDTLRVRTPTERAATFPVVGTVKGELDLLGKAVIDESATRPFGRLQPNFALARLAPDASPKDVQDAMDKGAEGPLPDGRGQEPEPAEGPAGAAGQSAARADLRAAVARDRGVGVRDREHARAVDPRAHARARHAARGRACRAARCGRWCATRR